MIGKYPIKELKAPVILDMLRQIERRGAVEMARRQAQVCGQIFRYAVATGVAEYDPVPSLRGALRPTPRGHHAAITPDELPEFLRILAKNEVLRPQRNPQRQTPTDANGVGSGTLLTLTSRLSGKAAEWLLQVRETASKR